MDATAGIVMGIALIFYTIGVWTEKIQGKLTIWHLGLFICGLICDSWGTGIMFRITDGLSFSFHGIAGLLAIVLMFLHATWALLVLIQNEERRLTRFHRFSLLVWAIWLIPYLSPMFIKLSTSVMAKL